MTAEKLSMPMPPRFETVKCAALKFFRLHPLVARAICQILCHFTDLSKRFVLRRSNHRRQQPIFNRDRDSKIDIRILNDRIVIE